MTNPSASSPSEHPYTVVVGSSGTSKSPSALTWAHAQARANGGRLIVVRSWRMPNPQATPSGTTGARVPRRQEVEAEALQQLAGDVAAVLGPDHGAEIRCVSGGPRKTLLKAAVDADLLVIDAPRALTSAPLFAHRIVYAASCPVVVMPPAVAHPGPSLVKRAGAAALQSAIASAGTAGRPGYRPPPHPEEQ